jgi:hypothetical protein
MKAPYSEGSVFSILLLGKFLSAIFNKKVHLIYTAYNKDTSFAVLFPTTGTDPCSAATGAKKYAILTIIKQYDCSSITIHVILTLSLVFINKFSLGDC